MSKKTGVNFMSDEIIANVRWTVIGEMRTKIYNIHKRTSYVRRGIITCHVRTYSTTKSAKLSSVLLSMARSSQEDRGELEYAD